jgi:ABC-type amino acid transport substrate-binding protein
LPAIRQRSSNSLKTTKDGAKTMGNRRLANWLTGAAAVMLAGMSAAQAQPIRFAVAAEPYPPYTEKQANGEWKGFEVDLIHKLCSEMKAECEIKEVAWDGIIPSLLAKKIDVIFSSKSVTEEREKQIAFSSQLSAVSQHKIKSNHESTKTGRHEKKQS